MRMLARKVPADLFHDRRTIPHDMFTRELAARVSRSGRRGSGDRARRTRRRGRARGVRLHDGDSVTGSVSRAGVARERHRRPVSSGLVDVLDALDASEAFVTPGAAAAIAANDHADERAALVSIAEMYAPIVADHDTDPEPGMFATIVERWADSDDRVEGIAHDVALVHLGSMSNLFAAVGWSIVDLVRRPDLVARVREGDRDLAERCALESIRLAQRSIMLREVLQSATVEVDGVEYHLDPGATIATLLPLTNRSAAPGAGGLRSRTLERATPRRSRRPRRPRIGHHVRPRFAHLSGSALLPTGDRRHDERPGRAVRPVARGSGSDSPPRTDRWRRPGRGTLPARVPGPVPSLTGSSAPGTLRIVRPGGFHQ